MLLFLLYYSTVSCWIVIVNNVFRIGLVVSLNLPVRLVSIFGRNGLPCLVCNCTVLIVSLNLFAFLVFVVTVVFVYHLFLHLKMLTSYTYR